MCSLIIWQEKKYNNIGNMVSYIVNPPLFVRWNTESSIFKGIWSSWGNALMGECGLDDTVRKQQMNFQYFINLWYSSISIDSLCHLPLVISLRGDLIWCEILALALAFWSRRLVRESGAGEKNNNYLSFMSMQIVKLET